MERTSRATAIDIFRIAVPTLSALSPFSETLPSSLTNPVITIRMATRPNMAERNASGSSFDNAHSAATRIPTPIEILRTVDPIFLIFDLKASAMLLNPSAKSSSASNGEVKIFVMLLIVFMTFRNIRPCHRDLITPKNPPPNMYSNNAFNRSPNHPNACFALSIRGETLATNFSLRSGKAPTILEMNVEKKFLILAINLELEIVFLIPSTLKLERIFLIFSTGFKSLAKSLNLFQMPL